MLKRNFYWPLLIIIGVLALFSFSLPAQVPAPQPFEDRVENAWLLYRKGDFPAALAMLDKVLLKTPKNAVAYSLRGEIKLYYLRDWEGARADTEMALRLALNAPGIEKVHSNLGVINQFRQRDEEALASFRKAIEINPNYAPPYNGMGVILERRGQAEQAMKAFGKSIELDGTNMAPFVGRGDLRLQSGDFDGALADFTKVVEREPRFESNWVRRGVVYAMLGRWEPAIDDIQKGFDLSRLPENVFVSRLDITLRDLDVFVQKNKSANAYAVRGLIMLIRDQPGNADSDLKKAFDLDSKLQPRLNDLISYLKRKNQK